MRYLILSDIHSNEEALAAVLSRMRRKRYDRVVVLGDLVGYGASPNQVLDRVRGLRRPKVWIRGNHDRIVVNGDRAGVFNPLAVKAARWTAEKLTARNRKFLASLPQGPLLVDGIFEICHGSPRDEDAYIFSDYDAFVNFRESQAAVCFFGHSHIPSVFTLAPEGIQVDVVEGSKVSWKLQPGMRYLVNPGSIGQPRDRNPDAAFAVYDAAERVVHFHRVPYDVQEARRKIHRAGLPPTLGDRLVVGA
jgi:predicted phosphodiesterase